MKQFKRLLSVLLAIIMILSSVSVLASAANGTAWKDSAIKDNQYNSIDVPTLTTEQYATAALDEVDRMLKEEQIYMSSDELFGIGELDVRSINAALDSVKTIVNGSLWGTASGLVKDLGKLDFSAITNANSPRRAPGQSDIAVIKMLLTFLTNSTNRKLIADFVRGQLDLGSIVGSFVDLSDFQVPKLLKELLYEATYNEDAPKNITQTVDTMVQDLIDALVVTGYDGDEPLLPALAGKTNISTGSMLTFIDEALKVVYNDYLVPRANDLWIDDLNELLADNAEEIEKYESYFNLAADGTVAFEFQTFPFDNSKLVLEQLNDVLGSIINLALADDIGFEWESGDNSMIVENIINIGKEVLAATGDDFFEPFVEIKTAEEIDAMTNQEAVSYVARTILNSSIDGVWIPDTADSIVKVGSYLVKDLMATELPDRDYSDESAYPVDDVNTIYNILADFGIKALNENPGLALDYGAGVDGLATAAANWAINKYSGFLSGVTLNPSASGWANLDTLLFKLINRNWFDASLFNGKPVTAENLIKDVLIGNILDLNFENVIALLCNKSSSSEFVSATPKQFVINLVVRILNTVFPGVLRTDLTNLESIITATNLGNTAEKLLEDLNTYSDSLLGAILPLLCDLLKLTNAQKFKNPEFNIPDVIFEKTGSITGLAMDFTNRSSGINTGYTDPATGEFIQDQLFKIAVTNVTISVTQTTAQGTTTTTKDTTSYFSVSPTSFVINGGETVPVTLKTLKNFSGTHDAVITVTYNIVREDGQNLTSQPLEARVYACITNAQPGDNKDTWTSTGTIQATKGSFNIFSTDVRDVADAIEVSLKNTGSADANITGYIANSTSGTALTQFPFYKANPESRILYGTAATDGQGGRLTYNPVVFDKDALNAAFPADEDTENGKSSIEKANEAAYTSAGWKKYTQSVGVSVNGATTGTATKSITVFIYDDCGLNSLFSKEESAQRQRFDYANADAEFNEYVEAMQQAARAVKTSKSELSFGTKTVPLFGPAFTRLSDAVEALNEKATGGVAALRADLDSKYPSNEGKNFMEDPDYSFFGAANYLTYTWSNFRDKYDDANDFAEDYEEGGKYYGIATPQALDVAYKTWELDNYYARLRPVTPSKINLDRAIDEANAQNYDGTLYTEESFDRYEKAIAFAGNVNGESDAVQVKINKAYVELIEAQKRLIKADSEEETEITILPADVNPYDDSVAVTTVIADEGEAIYVAPEEYEIDIADYFTVEGCDVADLTFDYEAIATGEELVIYDKNDNELASYILIVRGDLDGSGVVDTVDASTLNRYSFGIVTFGETGESVFDYAADVDASGIIDSVDVSSMKRFNFGMFDINFA